MRVGLCKGVQSAAGRNRHSWIAGCAAPVPGAESEPAWQGPGSRFGRRGAAQIAIGLTVPGAQRLDVSRAVPTTP